MNVDCLLTQSVYLPICIGHCGTWAVGLCLCEFLPRVQAIWAIQEPRVLIDLVFVTL